MIMGVDPADRRAKPRYLIPAEVQILRDTEIDVARARNLSIGGLYIAAAEIEHLALEPGARFDVVVSHHGTSVRSPARVIRQDPGDGERPPGIGIVFDAIDPENQALLRALIVRASRNPQP
jgi:hypothetical protein